MTTTDPEYDRLRDAALAYGKGPLSFTNGAREDLLRIAAEYARSPPPDPVPLRVEPPEGAKGDTFHWLADEDRIEPFCWTLTGRWQGIGRSGNWTAETVADDGWRYHSVASPCKPDTRIEPTDGPTDEAIYEWLKARHLEGNYYVQVLKDALTHFSPTQPAPVQRITDEEIEKAFGIGGIGDPNILDGPIVVQIVRTLLSKHTPTITKDQWEEIRKLAISDAPESFPYGVAKVLGRAP